MDDIQETKYSSFLFLQEAWPLPVTRLITSHKRGAMRSWGYYWVEVQQCFVQREKYCQPDFLMLLLQYLRYCCPWMNCWFDICTHRKCDFNYQAEVILHTDLLSLKWWQKLAMIQEKIIYCIFTIYLQLLSVVDVNFLQCYNVWQRNQPTACLIVLWCWQHASTPQSCKSC